MASIGYNKGYYSRSKYNDLAFQAEATITQTSSVTASLTQVHNETAHHAKVLIAQYYIEFAVWKTNCLTEKITDSQMVGTQAVIN